MDYGDYYWRVYRDYYRDPLPHMETIVGEYTGTIIGIHAPIPY